MKTSQDDTSLETGLQGSDIVKVPAETTPPTSDPPPNGGFKAWLQVLGAFGLFFSSWGITNSFGAYQTYYETSLGHSDSDIAWIGTMQGFLLFQVGVITGPLYDRGHLHILIYVGTFLTVFGLMMASLATQYYQVFLSLGVCVGLGSGCLFVPSVAIAAAYFTTKRAAATGLVASGGSIGGVIFPIIFHRLQQSIGYAWAMRVIAFIVLGALVISAVLLKPRVLPAKTRSLWDPTALRDPAFLLFSFSLFFIFTGLYLPFFYLPSYALQELDASANLAFYLLAIPNAGSIFGRIGPNILADKVGAIAIFLPFAFILTTLAFAWIAIKSIAGIIVFSILYGFFSGAIVSLPPAIVVMLSPDMSIVGTRMGMCFSFAGFGLLIGNPIAGVILNSKGGYTGLESFNGATIAVGAVFGVAAYFVHQRKVARK